MKRIIFILLCFLASVSAVAQKNLSVSGRVTDENGEPLIGVGVVISGTTTGTVTDVDGKYAINVSGNAILEFSSLGFVSVRQQVRGQKVLDVVLAADRNLLDEVVVVGYGTMKKSDLTGSVSSISDKSISNFKTSSIADALGGQLAGVSVVSADGTPGAGFDIKIRGVGTVNGDSSPLYIVDGFEVANIDFLANNDIKSIEVLKDASASAIYGSRAANGVILVTTKSGRSGRPEITYNGSGSFRQLSKRLEVLSPYEFVKLQIELSPTRYGTTYYAPGNDIAGVPYRFQTIDDYMNVKGLDWQSIAFRPTWSSSHDVNIMGGHKDGNYSISYSHYDEDGLFTNSGYSKDTARFKFYQKIFNWLRLDASVYYTNTKTTGVGTGGSTLTNIIQYRPVGGLYTSDYQLRYNSVDPLLEQMGMANSSYYNPLLNAEKIDNIRSTKQWIANAALTFTLAKGLTLKSSGSYNISNTRHDVFYYEGSSTADYGSGPYGNANSTEAMRYSINNVLTYNKTFAKKHRMTLTLGQEYYFQQNRYVYTEARDFPLDDLGPDNLAIGSSPSIAQTNRTQRSRLSFFGRAFYSYDDRYMVTATIRADASSVFPESNKWGFFPSFAASWNISEESFLEDVSWISNMKLRLGWGSVGNDRITENLSLNLYSPVKYGWGTQQITVLYPKQLSNSNLKWEGSTTTNAGLDLGFFDNRLNLTLDAFVKDSKDLLMAQDLSYVTGFASQWQNVGAIRNSGVEVTINTININKKNFSWTTDLNVSYIRNILRSLTNGSDYMLSRTGFNSNFTSYDYIAKVGEPLGNMYGYVFDGIYQTSDFYAAPDGSLILKDGVPDMSEHAGEVIRPGFVKYKDLDGDGVITTEDRKIIGNGQPDLFGGLTNTFNFYGIDLSFMLQFSIGNDVYNAQRMYTTQSKLQGVNPLKEVADRWTATNASNEVPSSLGYVTNDVYSRFIEDGSFLRLKNITLGYSLPDRWLSKIYVSKLRLYVTLQNLYCLTKYKGYDPEVNTLSSNLMPSFDYGAYPRSRVFTFGVDVKF